MGADFFCQVPAGVRHDTRRESGLSQLPARPVTMAPGFWISERKPRWMVSGTETTALQDRIISETRPR